MHVVRKLCSIQNHQILVFSCTNYIQDQSPSFSRILLPCLGRYYQIPSLSSRQSPVQSHPPNGQSQPCKTLQPPSRRRLVGDLSIFYRYFNGNFSQQIRDIIPVPLRRVRTSRWSSARISVARCLVPDNFLATLIRGAEILLTLAQDATPGFCMAIYSMYVYTHGHVRMVMYACMQCHFNPTLYFLVQDLFT